MCVIEIIYFYWVFSVQKRRSARNTQRKKYVDDIMLAISDDESGKSASPKVDSTKKSLDGEVADGAVKPNFVYIVSIFDKFFIVITRVFNS